MFDRLCRIAPLIARIVGAVFGGYVLGALSSVAALLLPIPTPQAVLTGALISFLVYAGAAIWVFIARNPLRAWSGLVIAAAPLALAAWLATSAAARAELL
ncbi:MAG: DUF3649 domain-containing protein [Paraburkholderia sp.]|nr:MAG: DUF3649 domain-containing protein [Paraburkholderia sp.]